MSTGHTMRVARYHHNHSVCIETVDRPTLGEREVLVRVMACGICSSDTLEWFRVPKSPRILGHEISGVVAASRSELHAPGDRVVIRNQVPCGRCHACTRGHQAVCEDQQEITPGGMAEYIRVPERVAALGLTPLPVQLSFAAGTLAEPIACTLHAQALASIAPGQCVVVIGAGPFGLLHVQLARNRGVERVVAVDKDPSRREMAARLGASLTLAPGPELADRLRTFNDHVLADVVVVATGSPDGLETGSRALGRYGTMLLFAVPAPPSGLPMSLSELFWRRELRIVNSYGAGDVHFSEAVALLERGVVDADALITHRVPLTEVQRGFDTVVGGGRALKVVLEMDR